jgi:POT family proton-dependent oligopeptide transporter
VSKAASGEFTKRPTTFLGHPIGLFVLFFTEMWERFSYYGMRALLLLYMVDFYKWTQSEASKVYKWYTALVYLTPLLGGFLADRYLGNKMAIIIGATLMAIGHFLMAFEPHGIFYAALVFLILGNGFFKPNMSTQVGRLYPANDPRRDSAYTIFYMGINLGAFGSPLICGWLKENTSWGYHAGFTAAGVGMVLGLLTYLFFIKWVEEVPEGVEYHGEAEDKADTGAEAAPAEHYVSEAEATTTPSASPALSLMAPTIFTVLGIALLGSFVIALLGQIAASMGVAALDPLNELVNFLGFDNFVAFGLGGGIASLMGGWVISKVSLALRDRVLVIYLVGLFVIFFWAAFEQAGNAMNLYADKTTDRFITEPMPEQPIYPAIPDENAGTKAASSVLNPVPTAWFQSINALAIFVLAPVFAWMWVKLPKMGINLSIPAKVAIGVFMQGMAFALMIWAVKVEDQPSSAALTQLPAVMVTDEEQRVRFEDAPDLSSDDKVEHFGNPPEDVQKTEIVHGGRIVFDAAGQKLNMSGVLADTDRDRILRATVPKDYLVAIRELAKKSTEAKKAANGGEFSASVTLPATPPGFDLRYAGFKEKDVRFNPETRELTTTVELADKDYKSILVAGADPVFRDALNTLFVASAKFKVSWQWLFWFYILCTLGELCLSPVGLSMVSKLAPARFATMLMGVWLLTSFFGNFVAGLAGESYGAVHPTTYFTFIAIAMFGASAVCFVVVKKLKSMMHGVN